MWKYNSTEELYHSKYIKKIKKNGKWRYYYDDSNINNAGYKQYEAHNNVIGTVYSYTNNKNKNPNSIISASKKLVKANNEYKKQEKIAKAATKTANSLNKIADAEYTIKNKYDSGKKVVKTYIKKVNTKAKRVVKKIKKKVAK